MNPDDFILKIEQVSLATRAGKNIVDNVSLSVGPGECIGLVGESGSGKTMTLRSMIGLLPAGIVQTGGTIEKNGDCAMIFQNPVQSLDPLCPVVRQLAEVIFYRQKTGRKEARIKALELLEQLGLPASLKQKDRYPGELSGGQCQRIVIAIALACRPDILLCDEPTTALDVTVQKQILETIRNLQQTMGFAVVFVTHNLAIASSLCSCLYVMKDGKIVESGETLSLLQQPQNPYTQMLIRSVLPLPEMERRETV